MSREFVLAHQRDRVINAMIEAVDRKGYTATSVADVLATARVSRTAFYELFRDKEDCFLACYDEGARLLLDAVRAALAQGGEWHERHRRVFAALLDVFVEHPKLARLCMVEALAAGAQANVRYRQAIAGLVELAQEDILADRDLPAVPTLAILGLVGGCSAIIYEEIAAGRTAQLGQKIDELTQFWIAWITGYERINRSGAPRLGRTKAR